MRGKGERIADGWKRAAAQASAKMIGGDAVMPGHENRDEQSVASDLLPLVRKPAAFGPID